MSSGITSMAAEIERLRAEIEALKLEIRMYEKEFRALRAALQWERDNETTLFNEIDRRWTDDEVEYEMALARAAIIEECARAAESYRKDLWPTAIPRAEFVAAIRALKKP